jgi:hypothetical protein
MGIEGSWITINWGSKMQDDAPWCLRTGLYSLGMPETV